MEYMIFDDIELREPLLRPQLMDLSFISFTDL